MKLNQLFIPLSGLALISLASPSYASDGQQYTRTFTVDAVGFLDLGTEPVFAEVPTMGVVQLLGCFGAPSYSIRTQLLSFDDAQPFFGVGTSTGNNLEGVESENTAGTFASGDGTVAYIKGGPDSTPNLGGTAGHFEWSLWREDGDNTPGAHVSIDGWNDGRKCYLRATVLQND